MEKVVLDQTLIFLNSNVKIHTFPPVAKDIEDILAKIPNEPCSLKGTRCDNVAAEISAILERRKHIFSLRFGYENDSHGNRVIVYEKVPIKNLKEPIPWNPLTKFSDKNSEDRNLTQKQQLKDIIRVIDVDIMRELIFGLRTFVKNANITYTTVRNITTSQMMFLSHWDIVVGSADIVQMFHEDVQRALNDIKRTLDVASDQYKLTVETVVTEHRSVKFMKVYCQKPMPLQKPAQSQPHSHSTLPIEPHSHSTQAIQPHSHSTQVIEPHSHSTQVIEPHSHSTQVIEPHSHSTQVIEPHSTQDIEVPGCVKIDKLRLKKNMAKFLIKAKSIPVDWIRTHLTRIKDFINSDQSTLVVVDDSEYYFFLRRSLNWLSISAVMAELGKEVEELLTGVHEAVLLNAPKFSVSAKYSEERNGGCKKLTFRKTFVVTKSEPKKPFSNKLRNDATEELTAGPGTGSNAIVPRFNLPGQNTAEKFLNKKHVPVTWIRTQLLRIKRFLGDSDSSMVISPVTKVQIAFLQRCVTWLGIIETPYDRSIQTLLKSIHDLVTQNFSKFKVKINTIEKRKKIPGQYSPGKVMFVKVPCSITKKKDVQGYINKFKAQNAKPETISNKPETISNKPETISNKPETISDFKIAFLPEEVKKGGRVDASVMESDVRTKRSDPVVDTAVEKRFKYGQVNTNVAKDQLIKGLDQPVDSVKGIMMMQSMGWKGGALGAREDGIVEPIKLPLDLARRAGLGSATEHLESAKIPTESKLPANITRKKIPYSLNKKQFLKIILQIVDKMQSEFKGIEIKFPSRVTERNWTFVSDIVVQLNKGGRMLVDPSLTDLAIKVMRNMRLRGDYINALWGTSYRNILFFLSKEVYQLKDVDDDWYTVVNVDPTIKQTIATNPTFVDTDKQTDNTEEQRTDTHNADIKYLQYCNAADEKNKLMEDSQTDGDNLSTGNNLGTPACEQSGDNRSTGDETQRSDNAPTGNENELTGKQNTSTGELNPNEPEEHYFDVSMVECVCCLPDYGNSDDDDEDDSNSANEFERCYNYRIDFDNDKENRMAETDREDSENTANCREIGEIVTDSEDELQYLTDGYKNEEYTLGKKRITLDKAALKPKDIQHIKRLSPDRNSHQQAFKRRKYSDYVKEISITPKHYPRIHINFKIAGIIQNAILEAIDYTKKPPLLKCHGIQNGALIYTCHSKKSYRFIKKIIKSIDLIQCTDRSGIYRMLLKTNTYTGECIEELLQRIEQFNGDICTKHWVIEQDCTDSDSLELVVQMDEVRTHTN